MTETPSQKATDIFRNPEQIQTPEQAKKAIAEVKQQMQGQAGGLMDMFSTLVGSKEGVGSETLLGAIMKFVAMAFGFKFSEKKETESGDKDQTPESNISQAVQPPKPQTSPQVGLEAMERKEVQVESADKFSGDNIFYVGDSYMVGISQSGIGGNKIDRSNVYAKTSRPFLPLGNWSGDNIAYHAKRALDNPKCKLLVLNGGLNDFYMTGNPKKTADSLIKTYDEIIKLARERGIKVIVYNVPKIPKSHPDKEQIYTETDRVNRWIDSQGLRTIDTGNVIGENYRKDGTHPKSYDKLFEQMESTIA